MSGPLMGIRFRVPGDLELEDILSDELKRLVMFVSDANMGKRIHIKREPKT